MRNSVRALLRRLAAPGLALAVLAAALTAAAPASAQFNGAGGEDAAPVQLGPADLKRVNALSGNTVAWAVLRKAVSLALSEAGLGKLAASPDNVDTVATVLALEDPERRLTPILAGAARGGLMAAANPALMATLGLDGSRPKGIACLVYGQAPEDRALLAELIALPEEERAACATHYPRIRDYWLKAAAPLLRPAGDETPTVVDVALGPASGTLASARSVLIAGETVDEVAYFLRRATRLPRPMLIGGTSCGAPRVDIEADKGQVTLCYELLAELVELIGQSIGG